MKSGYSNFIVKFITSEKQNKNCNYRLLRIFIRELLMFEILKSLCRLLQGSSLSVTEWDAAKAKLFFDNPFVCSTPSTTVVDMNGKQVEYHRSRYER